MKINYAQMFTLRKDGRYQARWSDETGRHCLYDRDPEALFRKLEAAKQPKPQEKPTFRQLADSWERLHREEISVRTWNNYEPHLKTILERNGDKPIDQVAAPDVIAHLAAAKAQGYSRTVVNTIRSLYSMIFDHAIATDAVRYNPVTSVKLPKGLKQGRRIAPTDDQIKIITQNINAPFGLFPFFLLCTGLRKSEALALTWKDVDLKAKLITVNKTLDYAVGSNPTLKPPKTEAGNRIVPIIDVLLPHLQDAYRAAQGNLLFPAPPSNRGGKGGGLMTLRSYEGLWERYCTAVGLTDTDGRPALGAHNLRHGTATLMFELGVDVYTTQRILGHSRIEVTQGIYTELRSKKYNNSVEIFNSGMTSYFDTKS